ncbi:tyrosine-protein phosphatase [Saccharopolyspora spinosa]|uniref:Protein tyrosine/serine phosphatase n=1 Tax=Saccharopolyspora spinosa TaxID=60894 RepID=A0A2N3YA31_SACSN|nr:tyrosine-protein phosphatase [Saccharopolyspora spinosa]PKW19723.1 protein tyrosine/serine phosphatase [Saccharopolyspora spinosa]
MALERNLDWDGLLNARDLGGLCVGAERRTRWGAVARSEDPAALTAAGWSALQRHGIRTIIDLTGDDEREPDAAPRPPELTTVRLPLDDYSDTEFWEQWGGGISYTPLYYQPFLDRFPQRVAEVCRAIARAEPGGVLVHCGGGRDRTGLIVLVLLVLVGADPADIASDYAFSHVRRAELCARVGLGDDTPKIRQLIAQHGTSEDELIREAATSRDMAVHLRSGGLSEADLTALRDRLIA